MIKYKVLVYSTSCTAVEVEAKNREEAREIVQNRIDSNQVVPTFYDCQEQEIEHIEKIEEVKEPFEEEFQFLERLRKSGAVNMWGATPYLAKAFKLPTSKAGDILSEWIERYDELNKKYNWQ